jgi:hypothetical protein
MSTLLFQIITVTADLVVFIFVGYYLFSIRHREKELKEKEAKADTGYHQVVDNALTRERIILDDATAKATQIITGAEYVNKTTKDSVNQALSSIVSEIQNDATSSAKSFIDSYTSSLKQLSNESLTQFQKVTQELKVDLQNQIKDFHNTMLPGLEKELEEYKQSRMKETDQIVTRVIQKVAQEVLNKSIPLSDHEALLTESLEKAKKEGIFE